MKKVSIFIRNLTLIFIIAFPTMILLWNPVSAQGSTSISIVNTATGDGNFVFYTNSSPIGYRFNITAWVYNVTDLFAYQIHLTYNSSFLSATNAWLPSWDSNWVFYGKQSAMPSPTVNTVNWVQLGDSILNGESSFNGTGLLAIIEFKIVDVPTVQGKVSSALSIDNTDTYLLDSALNDIPAAMTNGYYEYNWVTSPKPRFEVSPSQVDFGSSPPWAVGQEADVSVYIRSPFATWHVTNATFSLNFNASLLAINHIIVDSTWSQSTIDNATNLGQILVSAGRTTSTAHGDVLMMSVTFRVIYQGAYPRIDASDLILHNTQQYWLLDNFTEISVDPPLNGRIVINGLSASSPELSISPSQVELGPQRVLGKSFEVQIWLRELDTSWNLSCVTTRLDFNSTLIEPFAIEAGPFLSQFGNTVINSSIEANRVAFKQTLQNNPVTNPNGEGLIATIKFNVTYQKSVLGTLEAPLTIDSSLLQDNGGRIIPTKISNGVYKISSLTLTTVSMIITPVTAEQGFDVSIVGSITPAKANSNVTLYYRLNGTQAWTELGSVGTDFDGNFAFTWKTAGISVGVYEVKAELLGDETTYQSNSLKTISLVAEPSHFDPTIMILGALAILALVGIVMGVYLRKRHGHKSIEDSPLDRRKP